MMTMTRSPLDELIERADELADRFENYEPKPEDFDAPLPPLMAVHLAAFKRARAERELAEAITVARDARVSWRELGEAVGTTGEAVRQRYADQSLALAGRLDKIHTRMQERLAQVVRETSEALQRLEVHGENAPEFDLRELTDPPAVSGAAKKVAAKKGSAKVTKAARSRSATTGRGASKGRRPAK